MTPLQKQQEKHKNIQIIFLMASLMRMHKEYLTNNLKEENITRGELPFLIILYNQGSKTQKELADLFCFTESNAAKAIRNLEDKGILQREVNDNNRRQKIVSLTEHGKKTCEELMRIENEWEANITKKFTEDENEYIKKSLHIMLEESIKANKKIGER